MLPACLAKLPSLDAQMSMDFQMLLVSARVSTSAMVSVIAPARLAVPQRLLLSLPSALNTVLVSLPFLRSGAL